jgi:RecA-family ATPase
MSGAGKTTLVIDLAYHLACGDPWLGFAVDRPLQVLVIEDEGPRSSFQAPLRLGYALVMVSMARAAEHEEVVVSLGPDALIGQVVDIKAVP